jgi:hypothetical protein
MNRKPAISQQQPFHPSLALMQSHDHTKLQCDTKSAPAADAEGGAGEHLGGVEDEGGGGVAVAGCGAMAEARGRTYGIVGHCRAWLTP